MKNFSTRLKECRQNAHLTQAELANKLKIASTSYQRYENGTREPKLETLVNIAIFLSVSTDYLLGIKDDYK